MSGVAIFFIIIGVIVGVALLLGCCYFVSIIRN